MNRMRPKGFHLFVFRLNVPFVIPCTPFALNAREVSAPPLATLPLAFPCIDIPYKMTYVRPSTAVRCKTAVSRLNP